MSSPAHAEIRELRKSIGTQAEVAKLIGVTRETVNKYERDDGVPPAFYVLSLHELRRRKDAGERLGG